MTTGNSVVFEGRKKGKQEKGGRNKSILLPFLMPCPPPGDLPDPGIKLVSPAIQADSLLLSHQGSPITFSFLQTLTPPRPYWAFRSPCCNAEWLPVLGTWL